jgi:hypothetical protein
MKTITVSQEFFDAAMELASYIHETEYENYTEFLEDDNDAEDHIYYQASIINSEGDDSATILEQIEVDFNKTLDRIQ